MAHFQKKDDECGDWCHLCGARTTSNVEVWYPENAEHDASPKGPTPRSRYIRICGDCGARIADVSRMPAGSGANSAGPKKHKATYFDRRKTTYFDQMWAGSGRRPGEPTEEEP